MRTDGQTDRHDEADSRFSQFCKRAYKKEKGNIFVYVSYYADKHGLTEGVIYVLCA